LLSRWNPRRTETDLARRRGIEAIERHIIPNEPSGFEECYISGTGAEVTPVREMGPHSFTPGAMSRALIDDYSAAVRPKQKAAWEALGISGIAASRRIHVCGASPPQPTRSTSIASNIL
jgi:hypothetical protein